MTEPAPLPMRPEELVARCEVMLGTAMTAYLGGATDARTVDAWTGGWQPVSQATADRLWVAYLIVALLTSNGLSVAEAQDWLRDVNTELGNQSPAFLIRDSVDQAAYARILDEAFRYLASVAAL